jgi:hypothetical protein
MEWHKVIIMEPLDIVIKESAKPSYAHNQLSYYLTLDQCRDKKQYIALDNWINDITANLETCNHELIVELTHTEIELTVFSVYLIPRSELHDKFTVQQLEENYKYRLIQVKLPASFVQVIS